MNDRDFNMHLFVKSLNPIEHSLGYGRNDNCDWFWYGFKDEESCYKFLNYLEANGFEHRGICFKGYTIGVYYR